jgi:hypothetical protein
MTMARSSSFQGQSSGSTIKNHTTANPGYHAYSFDSCEKCGEMYNAEPIRGSMSVFNAASGTCESCRDKEVTSTCAKCGQAIECERCGQVVKCEQCGQEVPAKDSDGKEETKDEDERKEDEEAIGKKAMRIRKGRR